MPANMTTHTDTELDAARRKLLTDATAADLTAARVALGQLIAYIVQLQSRLPLLDDMALSAARRQARDLRQCAEALAIGVN